MKVLIVEDEPELLNEIEAYLKKDNYICEVAADFNIASEKLHLYHYDIHQEYHLNTKKQI